jgi:hypothetical protein
LFCYIHRFKYAMQVRQLHKELHQLEELQDALPGVRINFHIITRCSCYIYNFKYSMQVRQPHKELHQLEELQDALRQQLRRPGVAQQNVEVGLSKFSDVGAELLVRVSYREKAVELDIEG